MGGTEELTWGGWLVVMDGSVSCYGGQPIVLRLWVSLLPCWSTRRNSFGIVPDARLVLRTLGLAIGGRHWSEIGGYEEYRRHIRRVAVISAAFLLPEPTFHICCSLGVREAC